MNDNAEELISLIFGKKTSEKSQDGETLLDLVDEELHSAEKHNANNVSQSVSSDDVLFSRRSILKIIEE